MFDSKRIINIPKEAWAHFLKLTDGYSTTEKFVFTDSDDRNPTDSYIDGYKDGFMNGLDLKEKFKCQIFGYDVKEILGVMGNYYINKLKKKEMAKNLKYQWCEPNAKGD